MAKSRGEDDFALRAVMSGGGGVREYTCEHFHGK